jgi:RNA polymerase sigma-70 factor (ECF subfamily)
MSARIFVDHDGLGRGINGAMAEASSVLWGGSDMTDAPEFDERLAALAENHFAYVWRVLRRLGIADADADDVAQGVFLRASRRLDDIRPEAERSFLYRMAIHAAYKHRRTESRRREDALEDIDLPDEALVEVEELIDRRRAREMLDKIVAAMPVDFRVVFVLYEVEGLGTEEIAKILDIPSGTVASRLRRARADFEARVARLETRIGPRGGHHD